MRRPFKERLGKEWLFCDGATGTVLQQMGLKGGEPPELWNLTHPEAVLSLYKGYLQAGSDIFNANTFGVNALRHPGQVKEIVSRAVELAVKAREECGRDDAYIDLDIGPSGKLLKPFGDLAFDDAVTLFGEVVKAGAQAGADLVLIETMTDSYEAKAAVLAAKENCDLPVCITLTYDRSGRLLNGGTVASVVAMLEGLKVDAIGVNCGFGPQGMIPIVKELKEYCSLPLIVNPNAGMPHSENGSTSYDLGPEEFSDCMQEIAKLGVQVVGGCCGTTPEYIRRTIRKVKEVPFQPNTAKHRSFVTSYSKAVEIGQRPVLVGERINPTGKKRFKEALKNHDLDYVLDQGLQQEDAGADILDVNVGLPGIKEAPLLEEVVLKLQGVTNLPLQLDTTDPEALERALRIYNGKAMVNSVNGKAENIALVMPLVAKYGGVLVALPLDENGIPETAHERLKVAEKIYLAADRYGIPRSDIVIDGLTMTVSAKSDAALTALDVVRGISRQGGHSILGVSNVSFGLPERQLINSYFLAMALECGLSAAIMNPNNVLMMAGWRTSLALLDKDPQCASFIKAYADGASFGRKEAPRKEVQAEQTDRQDPYGLFHAIAHGLSAQAEAGAKTGLKDGKSQLDLIDRYLIPALDQVGKDFEKGRAFLPQLLMSADAAKAAFAVIKASLSDKPRQVKGRLILATVKGDVHDIGKNIVKVLLENYGYEVVDLGKDVPPEVIVDTAIKERIPLVGLSALMTTTVVSMEETIRLLRARKPGTKVIVGGAVMTADYAREIGADAYGKDAMATVRYADQVFAKGEQANG